MNSRRRPSFRSGIRDYGVLFGLFLALLLGGGSVRAAIPAAPTLLRSIATSGSAVTIIWNDNSTDETAYRITYWSAGDTGNFQDALFASGPGTGYGFCGWTTFPVNISYSFWVQAVNASGVSAAANQISVNIGSFNNPTDLTVLPVNDGRFELGWCDNAFNESGYLVDAREASSSGTGTWVTYSACNPDTCAIAIDHDSWMIPSRSYEFRVIGFSGSRWNPSAYTAYTSVVKATVPALVAPTNFTATASSTSPDKISFSWTDNSSMEHGYELEYRKQNLASPQAFTTLRYINANVTSLANLPGFEPGTIYEFRLRAAFYVSDTETIGSTYIPSSGGIAATTKNGFNCKPYASGTFGNPFSYSLTYQSRSTRSSWTVGTLPEGLSFNNSTGVISGTAKSTGLFSIPMTVTFADGSSHTQTLALRVIRPPAAPLVTGTIPGQTLTVTGSTSISLGSSFSDPDTERAVRIVTSRGNIDCILYSGATPQTVANFLRYANDGYYNGTLFHRSIPGFILQGGGYFIYDPDTVTLAAVPTYAAVANEPGFSNTYGTLSMAKVADQPDSATNQFFINLGNNSANLDNQNGGFTVFGRVAAPSLSGTGIVATLSGIPTNSYYFDIFEGDIYTGAGSTSTYTLSDVPLDSQGIPWIESVTTDLPVLTYAIATAPDSDVATAALSGSSLQIRAVASGTTRISVSATDVDGNTTTQSFNITVQKTLAEWASEQGLSGTSAEPGARRSDGLTNLHAFAFMADPVRGVPARLPSVALKTSDATPRAKVTFPVRKYASGLTYVVEASDSLASGSWTTLWSSTDGLSAANVSAVDDQTDRTVVTIADPQAASASPRRFLRVKLIGP